jgi:hypothetical protein
MADSTLLVLRQAETYIDAGQPTMASKAESPEDIKRLSAEHSALARQQHEALQKSPYFQMSDSEANAYDERSRRIGVICEGLAEFRSKAH